jgi:hypothetical protein
MGRQHGSTGRPVREALPFRLTPAKPARSRGPATKETAAYPISPFRTPLSGDHLRGVTSSMRRLRGRRAEVLSPLSAPYGPGFDAMCSRSACIDMHYRGAENGLICRGEGVSQLGPHAELARLHTVSHVDIAILCRTDSAESTL